MELKKHKEQVKFSNNTMDITDPSYDEDVWCRASMPIKNGIYDIYYTIDDCRIYSLYLVRKGIELNVEEFDLNKLHVCSVGVDAGLCGFFDNKDDYSDEAWRLICDAMLELEDNGYDSVFTLQELCDYIPALHTLLAHKQGVFCSSGYGDGSYPVYADKTIGIFEIKFIIDDEEDDQWKDDLE